MSELTTAVCPERLYILGFPVDAFNKYGLINFISDRVGRSERSVIAHLNLHSLHCLQSSQGMDSLMRRPETVVHIDGMPIAWLLMARGHDVTRQNRLTYLDWAEDLVARAATDGWKVAYIGSSADVCDQAILFFQTRHPSLFIRGWNGYFDMDNNAPGSPLRSMLDELAEFKPDLLFVGMGQPRQEEFVDRYFDALSSTVSLCCGAFFEYFVAQKAPPPRWMGRVGLEWFYRLLQNPRRYSHRYLVEPVQLMLLLALRRSRGK